MMPTSIRYCKLFTNSVSEIRSSAHQPAVFFTHAGTDCSVCELAEDPVDGITIIPSLIRYCIPCRNDESSIISDAHQPALFLIQAGTLAVSANALGVSIIPIRKIIKKDSECLINSQSILQQINDSYSVIIFQN